MGGVNSTWHMFRALADHKLDLVGVLGLDESQRERVSTYRSLRELANAHGIPFQPFVRVRDPFVREFVSTKSPDLLLVIGLSQLVPDDLVSLASRGGLGFHPTMLPQGRGRAPVAWTILRGAQPAVSLFSLTDEADAGDIVYQQPIPVHETDYAQDLIDRICIGLEKAVAHLAPAFREGNLPSVPQNEAEATYWPKRGEADGIIDWSTPTAEIHRLIRAVGRPYPGAYSFIDGWKVRIWRASPEGGSPESRNAPGTVVDSSEDGYRIQTIDGVLRVTDIEVLREAEVKDVLLPGAKMATTRN